MTGVQTCALPILHFRVVRFLSHGEIHHGVVRHASIYGKSCDARTRDHGEGEETRPQDVTERLEATDRFADAFEPAIGPDSRE